MTFPGHSGSPVQSLFNNTGVAGAIGIILQPGAVISNRQKN